MDFEKELGAYLGSFGFADYMALKRRFSWWSRGQTGL